MWDFIGYVIMFTIIEFEVDIMRKLVLILISVFLAVYSLSCSTHQQSPVEPQLTASTDASDPSRILFGLWDVDVIPDNSGSAQLIFTPLRSTALHMNVVKLMENSLPGAVGVSNITLQNGVLGVDVSFTHPFPSDTYSGFDVRGILIGHGSVTDFDENLKYAGKNDLRLLNPDGHTRLWNPVEYLGSGYKDGKLGTPNSVANFTATLNGYKYFADDLGPNDDVTELNTSLRGAFTGGTKNTRRYMIKLGSLGLKFQYAVDANWWPPTEPAVVPGSFDVNRANCPEPYYLDVWIGPGIWHGGGSADFTLDVYDWQGDITEAFVDASPFQTGAVTLTNPVAIDNYFRFTGTITNENLPDVDFGDILFYAAGTDPDSLKQYKTYKLVSIPTGRVPDGGVIITIQDDIAFKTIGTEYLYESAGYDWSTGNPAPIPYLATSGLWDFTAIPNENQGFRAALSPDDPEVVTFVNDFSSYVTHFWRTSMSLGADPTIVYQAESHNAGSNLQMLWGLYEAQTLEGSIAFNPPINFQYPMINTTHYKVVKTVILIPILLNMTLNYEMWGVGQGTAIIDIEPGYNGWGWDCVPVLKTRTVLSVSTGGTLGEGLLGTALMYDWIADDGKNVGSVVSGNNPGSDPNFNESTYEIIAVGGANTLREIL